MGAYEGEEEEHGGERIGEVEERRRDDDHRFGLLKACDPKKSKKFR